MTTDPLVKRFDPTGPSEAYHAKRIRDIVSSHFNVVIPTIEEQITAIIFGTEQDAVSLGGTALCSPT